MSEVTVYKEITKITELLIRLGLSIDQKFPSISTTKEGNTVINWGKSDNLSIVFKNLNYKDIYSELEKESNFNAKLIDGALLQLMYTFDKEGILTHRLAFFPSPDLESYQNDPELYEKEDLYADILSKNIVPVPIRFDYDRSSDIHVEVDHAKSHVTFGQYKNCRIPVSGPIGPSIFVSFILRNFYSTVFKSYSLAFESKLNFERTITPKEEKIIHFNVVSG